MSELYRPAPDSDEASSIEEIVRAFRKILSDSPPRGITLLNFYKGVRIEYGAEVLDASETAVTTRVHPYTEAAICTLRQCFVKGANFPCDLLALAETHNPPDGTAHLFSFRPVVILADIREFLRVQFSPPPPAEVTHKGTRFTGHLLDISPRSAAVLLPPDLPLKAGYRARIRATVGPGAEDGPIVLDALGDVLRTAGEGGMRRFVFALIPDTRVEQTVSRIVGWRQREILIELKGFIANP